MSDLIDRQAAIDALQKEINKGKPPFDDVMGSIRCGVRLARNIIEDLPSAQQTLFGYKIEHLAYIAKVMEKEGITAEYAVRTFNDMSRAIRMIIEEAQQKAEEMLNERFNKQTGCN